MLWVLTSPLIHRSRAYSFVATAAARYTSSFNFSLRPRLVWTATFCFLAGTNFPSWILCWELFYSQTSPFAAKIQSIFILLTSELLSWEPFLKEKQTSTITSLYVTPMEVSKFALVCAKSSQPRLRGDQAMQARSSLDRRAGIPVEQLRTTCCDGTSTR